MSTLKRKDAPGDHPPAKSAKSNKEARPSRKDAKTEPKSAQKTTDTPKAAPVVSILKDEEPMFPRGGGSVLTPLEHKQIHIQAKADAIREEEFDTGKKVAQKKRKKSLSKGGDKKQADKQDEDSARIESLRFKVR